MQTRSRRSSVSLGKSVKSQMADSPFSITRETTRPTPGSGLSNQGSLTRRKLRKKIKEAGY